MFSRKKVAEWVTVFAMKVTCSLQLRVSCLAQKPLKIIISFFFSSDPCLDNEDASPPRR